MEESSIRNAFYEKYDRIFEKAYPRWAEVKGMFAWLMNESVNAIRLRDVEILDELRRDAESYFCKFRNLKDDVEKESKKVKEALSKRDEKLRETRTNTEADLLKLSGKREKEKEPPPT